MYVYPTSEEYLIEFYRSFAFAKHETIFVKILIQTLRSNFTKKTLRIAHRYSIDRLLFPQKFARILLSFKSDENLFSILVNNWPVSSCLPSNLYNWTAIYYDNFTSFIVKSH